MAPTPLDSSGCTNPAILDRWHPVAPLYAVEAGGVHTTQLLGVELQCRLDADGAAVVSRLDPLGVEVAAIAAYGCVWACLGDPHRLGQTAVFPDVVLAEEGGVDLLDYPAVRRWLDRVKQWPDFVVMPGVFPFGTS